jgi:hypothetical protein
MVGRVRKRVGTGRRDGLTMKALLSVVVITGAQDRSQTPAPAQPDYFFPDLGPQALPQRTYWPEKRSVNSTRSAILQPSSVFRHVFR